MVAGDELLQVGIVAVVGVDDVHAFGGALGGVEVPERMQHIVAALLPGVGASQLLGLRGGVNLDWH